jgi:hypothetical protein
LSIEQYQQNLKLRKFGSLEQLAKIVHVPKEIFVGLVVITTNNFRLWHHHYGHVNHKYFELMHQKGLTYKLIASFT